LPVAIPTAALAVHAPRTIEHASTLDDKTLEAWAWAIIETYRSRRRLHLIVSAIWLAGAGFCAWVRFAHGDWPQPFLLLLSMMPLAQLIAITQWAKHAERKAAGALGISRPLAKALHRRAVERGGLQASIAVDSETTGALHRLVVHAPVTLSALRRARDAFAADELLATSKHDVRPPR
jgi:hypothetical protein